MVQAASLFNQLLLHHFRRTEFASLLKKRGVDRATQALTCWRQFVAMPFCQLGWAHSLHEIGDGVTCRQST